MTTATINVAPTNGLSGGTEIRAWVQAVHDALEDIGFVQTADTGQVDIATMTNPTSANTYAGYEVWRFADALQATAPLFFKLEYGRGGSGSSVNAQPTPQMAITVGTGSDGEGGITGTFVDRLESGYSSTVVASSAVASNGYLSSGGDGAMLALFPFADAAIDRPTPAFFVERSRDINGEATADGLVIALGPRSSIADFGLYCVNYETGVYTSSGILAPLPAQINGSPLSTGSLLGGTIAPLFPLIAMVPGATPWQVRGLVAYPPGDAPSGTFDARLSGTTRTYRALNGTAIQWARTIAVGGTGSPFTGCIGIEWE